MKIVITLIALLFSGVSAWSYEELISEVQSRRTDQTRDNLLEDLRAARDRHNSVRTSPPKQKMLGEIEALITAYRRYRAFEHQDIYDQMEQTFTDSLRRLLDSTDTFEVKTGFQDRVNGNIATYSHASNRPISSAGKYLIGQAYAQASDLVATFVYGYHLDIMSKAAWIQLLSYPLARNDSPDYQPLYPITKGTMTMTILREASYKSCRSGNTSDICKKLTGFIKLAQYWKNPSDAREIIVRWMQFAFE